MSIATKEVCVCDQCGRERDKDTNHWWTVCYWTVDRMFIVQPWDATIAAMRNAQHICGLTCLYKAIDKLAQEILKREAVTPKREAIRRMATEAVKDGIYDTFLPPED